MNMYFVGFGWLLVAGVIIYYIRVKSIERLTMIEKGIDPNSEDRKKNSRLVNLRNGIFLFSASIGIIVGNFIRFLFPEEPFVGFLASILFFVGIGLIIYFHIIKNKID